MTTTKNINKALENINKKYDELRKGFSNKVVSAYEFVPSNEKLALYQVYADSQATINEDCKAILKDYDKEDLTLNELMEKDFYTNQRKNANKHLVKEVKPLSDDCVLLKKCVMSDDSKAYEQAQPVFKRLFDCELSINDYSLLVQFLATANKKQRGVKEQAVSPLDLWFNLATDRKIYLGDFSTKSARNMVKKAYNSVVIITENEYCNGVFESNNQSSIVNEYILKANISLKKDEQDNYSIKADKVRKAVSSGRIVLKPNSIVEKEEQAKKQAQQQRARKEQLKKEKARAKQEQAQQIA